MPERNGRHHQQSFSFVVADNRSGVTEYAIHLTPDILEHVAVCLQEIRRHHDMRHADQRIVSTKKKTTAKAVLDFKSFKKRKRTA